MTQIPVEDTGDGGVRRQNKTISAEKPASSDACFLSLACKNRRACPPRACFLSFERENRRRKPAFSHAHADDGGHRARSWCSGQALRRGGHAIRLSSSARFFWTPVARRTAGTTSRARFDSSSATATRVAVTTANVGQSPSGSARPVGHPSRAGCAAGDLAGRRYSHPPRPSHCPPSLPPPCPRLPFALA